VRRARLVTALCAAHISSPPAIAAGPGPRLVVLASTGGQTEVRVLELDGARPRILAARLAHTHDGFVRGAIASPDEALVTVEEDGGSDRSFSGALWRVDLSGQRPPRRVLGGLAYASRPLVVGRRAFLQTGRPGAARADGSFRQRDDDVAVTELDLDSGRARQVFTLHGQLAYPVGVDERGRLVVYAVGPAGSLGDGGRALAVDLDERVTDLGVIGTARDLSLVPALPEAGLGPAVVYEGRGRDGTRPVLALGLDGRHALLKKGSRAPLAPLVDAAGHLLTAATDAAGAIEVPREASAQTAVLQRYLARDPLPQLVVRRGSTELVVPRSSASERLEPVGLVESR
jgi:hypothetical protein